MLPVDARMKAAGGEGRGHSTPLHKVGGHLNGKKEQVLVLRFLKNSIVCNPNIVSWGGGERGGKGGRRKGRREGWVAHCELGEGGRVRGGRRGRVGEEGGRWRRRNRVKKGVKKEKG